MTAPTITYHTPFLMSGGEKPNLTEGKTYSVFCAYSFGTTTTILVIDDKNEHHGFDTTDDWFSEHFTLIGDLEEVWERT